MPGWKDPRRILKVMNVSTFNMWSHHNSRTEEAIPRASRGKESGHSHGNQVSICCPSWSTACKDVMELSWWCAERSYATVASSLQRVWFSVTSRTAAPRPLCPWDFLGKKTEVRCHVLLQGIFLMRGLNTGLLHCRHIFFFFLTSEPPEKPKRNYI